MKNRRFLGFTLAEVLITLGVIGIVAALTLPTLIQNWQKKAYAAQLKKTYSILQNGCRMMLAENQVDSLEYVPNIDSEENLKHYFKGIRKTNNNDSYTYTNRLGTVIPYNIFNTGFAPSYMFQDSAMISAVYSNKKFSGYIDVNGLSKNPNRIGYDLFYYAFDEHCRSILTNGAECLNPPQYGHSHEDAVQACTSYVIQNGWVIDYSPKNNHSH